MNKFEEISIHKLLLMLLMKESVLSLKKQHHNAGYPTFKQPAIDKF